MLVLDALIIYLRINVIHKMFSIPNLVFIDLFILHSLK